MSTQLLKTKFFIPEPSSNIVSRPRLREQKDHGLAGKLTLVAAPAGFGKTTLLSCWLQNCSRIFAWVSLDETNNDIAVFWAFSNSAHLKEEFAEWFPLTMTGLEQVKVAPLPLSAGERQSISLPVLFIFGERDNLVGDPAAAKSLVQDMPDVQVEIVEAGHQMGGELPGECNHLILDFFGRP